MKTLVAYYSRTGNTKRVAEALAETLNADIEAIVSDTKDKGMGRLAMQAFLRVHAKIAQTTNDPASYDLVVVGSPVWAGKMSSPIRTYLAQNKDEFTSVAFFCTHGQPGSEGSAKMLESMETLSGKKSAGMLDVAANDVESAAYVEKAKRFAAALLELPSSQ
ncbi:MAG: flavodoxin [Halobacteriota archaeon]|jgi:flavodoxin